MIEVGPKELKHYVDTIGRQAMEIDELMEFVDKVSHLYVCDCRAHDEIQFVCVTCKANELINKYGG